MVLSVRMPALVSSRRFFNRSKAAPRLGRVFFKASISPTVVLRIMASQSEQMKDAPQVRSMARIRVGMASRMKRGGGRANPKPIYQN